MRDSAQDTFWEAKRQPEHADDLHSEQWKSYIRIRFNFWQRLRVLFGQRVFVFFQAGTPPAHYEFVAPTSYDPYAR